MDSCSQLYNKILQTRGEVIMMLYSRCTNVIREKRYVGKYYSIAEYQCSNKVMTSGYCHKCREEK